MRFSKKALSSFIVSTLPAVALQQAATVQGLNSKLESAIRFLLYLFLSQKRIDKIINYIDRMFSEEDAEKKDDLQEGNKKQDSKQGNKILDSEEGNKSESIKNENIVGIKTDVLPVNSKGCYIDEKDKGNNVVGPKINDVIDKSEKSECRDVIVENKKTDKSEILPEVDISENSAKEVGSVEKKKYSYAENGYAIYPSERSIVGNNQKVKFSYGIEEVFGDPYIKLQNTDSGYSALFPVSELDVVYVINKKDGGSVEYDKYDFKNKQKITFDKDGEEVKDSQRSFTDEEFKKVPFIHEAMQCFKIIEEGDKNFYREFRNQFSFKCNGYKLFPSRKVIESNKGELYSYSIGFVNGNMYVEIKNSKTGRRAFFHPNEKNVVYIVDGKSDGEIFYVKYALPGMKMVFDSNFRPIPNTCRQVTGEELNKDLFIGDAFCCAFMIENYDKEFYKKFMEESAMWQYMLYQNCLYTSLISGTKTMAQLAEEQMRYWRNMYPDPQKNVENQVNSNRLTTNSDKKILPDSQNDVKNQNNSADLIVNFKKRNVESWEKNAREVVINYKKLPSLFTIEEAD